MMLNTKGLVPALAVGAAVVLGVTGCTAGGGTDGGGGGGGDDTIKIGVMATVRGQPRIRYGRGQGRNRRGDGGDRRHR